MKLNAILEGTNRREEYTLKILEQDERIKLGDFDWVASNGVRILSNSYPEIRINNLNAKNEEITIFLIGDVNREDKKLFTLNDKQKVKVQDAIREFQLYEPSSEQTLEEVFVSGSCEIWNNILGEDLEEEVKQESLKEVCLRHDKQLAIILEDFIQNAKVLIPELNTDNIDGVSHFKYNEIYSIKHDKIEAEDGTVYQGIQQIFFRDEFIIALNGSTLIVIQQD
jgi:hypothetical protein